VYFTDAKSLAAVRRYLAGAHVEPAKTISAAIAYCKKDGDFFEQGTAPVDPRAKGQLEIERWNRIWESAILGDIENIPPDVRIRYYGTLGRIKRDYMVPPGNIDSVCGTWIYGSSGVGKSHSVRALFPELYSKNASKWWDGYQKEDTVLLDDIGTSEAQWASRFLKIWADKYSFIADVKGGSICIRPKRLIVTSQYTIRGLFTDPETVDALERRFTVIHRISQEETLVIN